MPKAVLFKSEERFDAFAKKLAEYNIAFDVLDFGDNSWLEYDFSSADILIYYPTFKFSSNHPLALYEVYDNLMHIKMLNPSIRMYPDPKIIHFYNDKYKQYLYLNSKKHPMPETYPLYSSESLDLAEIKLGFPMILKNRFGAGGDNVFQVNSRKELEKYYNLSKMDYFNLSAFSYLFSMFTKRIFLYHLIKERKMNYPFLAVPLLAQKFIAHDRDIKTVVGNHKVVEAHWRLKAQDDMWKMNIDGGGIGQWSKIPSEVIAISENLAKGLDVSWLNIDFIKGENGYMITEFSPVWHHYAYKEKPSFVYKDDYNIDMPLEKALDLERIIIESMI
ncbi:MAG: RimK family alpha-L-glutamate ligase [Calditrichaceae bacterium]